MLLRWVEAVRKSCFELGRSVVGDLSLGKLLSTSPIGKDGVWPCEPVREVVERIQSKYMSDGIQNGLYNARGVHFRGEGGDQERELADKYRKWANALQYSHPFVASTLLMGMVNTYGNEASREDIEADIKRRLRGLTCFGIFL